MTEREMGHGILPVGNKEELNNPSILRLSETTRRKIARISLCFGLGGGLIGGFIGLLSSGSRSTEVVEDQTPIYVPYGRYYPEGDTGVRVELYEVCVPTARGLEKCHTEKTFALPLDWKNDRK